jgi:hypothetical protein
MATAEPSGDVQLAYSYERFCRLDELDELDVVDIGSSWRCGAGRLRNSINDVEQGWAWTDRKPDDEAALRSGTPVRVGGAIVGHVDGLIAGFDEHITAVLVACGHFWSRRTIAVPVDALTSVDSTGVTIADRWGLRAPLLRA